MSFINIIYTRIFHEFSFELRKMDVIFLESDE